MMKISKALRLVVPIETEQGQSFVHATAIDRETYEMFCPVFLRAFNAIVTDAGNLSSGPKVAATYMRRSATGMGVNIETLMAEIVRLANVVILGPNGPELVPLDEVFKKGLIDADDKDEVENALAFFTLGFYMLKRSERESILTEVSKIWGGKITSLDFTEFTASLQTSTETASSGAKAPVSSAIY